MRFAYRGGVMKSSTTDLHNPNLVDGMQPNDATKSPPTRLIQRQIDRGFVGLRFLGPLERDFHDYLRHSSRLSRAGLIFFALAGVFSCALIDVRWLDVPYELVGATRFIQVSVMAPMIFLCLFLCLRVPTSAAMELGTALMFVVMSASLLSLRVVYAQAGFQLPLELIGASAVAMLLPVTHPVLDTAGFVGLRGDRGLHGRSLVRHKRCGLRPLHYGLAFRGGGDRGVFLRIHHPLDMAYRHAAALYGASGSSDRAAQSPCAGKIKQHPFCKFAILTLA
ncbi:hypothetical protein [Salinisphaera shabanensis]|uniref:hypothetical protein n=1 Tax=Salinisphaera shabanensis TaxID=180542 RepID=UPI00333F6355